jgi:hypothetical protein
VSWTFQVFLNTKKLGIFAMLYLPVLRMDDKVCIPSAISTNSEYSNLRQSFDEYLAADFLYPSSVIGFNEEFGTSTSTAFDPISDILNNIGKENKEQEEQHEKPFLKIIEEPAANLYRFRYGSEGDTAGTIPGEKQKHGRKSFPKVILENYEGPAMLEVCCLTEDFKVHPNRLVRNSYTQMRQSK